jgi:hypothetical protein
MMVHGDHAEQMVVVFGDGLPRPVPVHVTDDEVLEVATEGAFVSGHEPSTYCASAFGIPIGSPGRVGVKGSESGEHGPRCGPWR